VVAVKDGGYQEKTHQIKGNEAVTMEAGPQSPFLSEWSSCRWKYEVAHNCAIDVVVAMVGVGVGIVIVKSGR